MGSVDAPNILESRAESRLKKITFLGLAGGQTSQIVNDAMEGRGTGIYNLLVGVPNTINVGTNFVISPFTKFQFGYFETYKPATIGEKGAMTAVDLASLYYGATKVSEGAGPNGSKNLFEEPPNGGRFPSANFPFDDTAPAPKVQRFRAGPQGELESAFAKVSPEDLGTGTPTTEAARTLAERLGQVGDDAGHAMTNLGGPGGARSGNIFLKAPV